jgi:NADH:ubiquinone oxidoreductase subunit F (NADH-binding)/(2Fe-2S) ferredoxin/Pyruvate/2-oxoacid:ferredoxin oxidoreductase delta subunit
MKQTFLVCCDTGCLMNGSEEVAQALERAISALGTEATVKREVKRTGCHGCCERGPMVQLEPDHITYYKVKPPDASELVQAAASGSVVERLVYHDPQGTPHKEREAAPFYASQVKIALRNVGAINPDSLDDYLARGGYEALRRAITMTPDAIISAVEASGLRGRGGAGFPTGAKWRSVTRYNNFPKYVICNGDEGDPGAFMDRSILEGDPHSVLEGMAICALSIGATEGFLYIRDEYDMAVRVIRRAIEQAEQAGFLGDHLLGTDKSLHLSVVRGGGAFVCGESTALMQSVEGKVGEPRAKYIRSAQRGLWDQPTVLNNVETWVNVPVILRNGAEKFAGIGTENSKGTKVFALVGKVQHTGLVEVPMGTTLRHLIFDIGGGIQNGRPFKAVQTGGPSGGCIPESMLDLPVDFDTLKKYGAMMGSGGMIVMDDRSCMVEVARYYVNFLCGESCGKCTPCREGLRQMLAILTDICEGRGRMEDLDLLQTLGETMQDASLCALGKSAPNPVLTTLKYFRSEYEAHIREHRCPAGVCKALTRFAINPQACRGCGACARACPAGAISGTLKKPHSIDAQKCIACGSCREACHFGAVQTLGKGESV